MLTHKEGLVLIEPVPIDQIQIRVGLEAKLVGFAYQHGSIVVLYHRIAMPIALADDGAYIPHLKEGGFTRRLDKAWVVSIFVLFCL